MTASPFCRWASNRLVDNIVLYGYNTVKKEGIWSLWTLKLMIAAKKCGRFGMSFQQLRKTVCRAVTAALLTSLLLSWMVSLQKYQPMVNHSKASAVCAAEAFSLSKKRRYHFFDSLQVSLSFCFSAFL